MCIQFFKKSKITVLKIFKVYYIQDHNVSLESTCIKFIAAKYFKYLPKFKSKPLEIFTYKIYDLLVPINWFVFQYILRHFILNPTYDSKLRYYKRKLHYYSESINSCLFHEPGENDSNVSDRKTRG